MYHLPPLCTIILLCACVLTAAAVSAKSAAEATPTTPAELQARVRQLRKEYAPVSAQSAETAGGCAQQTDLSGSWRWKAEVEDFTASAVPPAPEWYRVELDDSTWETTTVPEWRYDKPEPPGTKPDPRAHRPESRIVWYRKSFTAAPPPGGRRVFLVFQGVDWEAEVWLNGTFLAAIPRTGSRFASK